MSTLAEDIWEAVLTWVESKQEKLRVVLTQAQSKRKLLQVDLTLAQSKREKLQVQKNPYYDEQKKTSHPTFRPVNLFRWWTLFQRKEMIRGEEIGSLKEEIQSLKEEIRSLEKEIRSLEEETRALEMFLPWVMDGGKEALKLVEDYVLEGRRVKPTDINQHVDRLLKLMDQEYCQWQWLHNRNRPLPSHEKIFKTILEEIPKLVGMHQRLRLGYYFTPGFQLSLDKILRLSSWTPSSTHNKNLHELLREVLLMLNDLGGNEEYHDTLRDFMKQHTALCVFTLDNADVIPTDDPEKTADLCKNLRRLAQNLGKIASTKAEQYQKLYDNFIAHREELSRWLDSASPEQGRSIVDSFTDSLKNMASSMRREANFWNSQSNQFHKWPNIRETYGSALIAMPPFPSGQLDDYTSSTTPSIHASGLATQNAEPDPQRVPQAAQRVSVTFAHLQNLRVNTTQAFLAKSENSISKRMRETHGYLEFAVEVAEKQVSRPTDGYIPKVIVRLAEKALGIAKRWDKLQRKVKYCGGILSVFSKPLAFRTFDMISGISRDDFLEHITATPDMLIHPYVIEFEISLRDMWHHFLSRTHFWARIDSDPATFTSYLQLSVLNED